MSGADAKTEWESYRRRELEGLVPVLKELGFSLEKEQPHTGGERYLMSGKKLVLLGVRDRDGKRAVIKASGNAEGSREITREHDARRALATVRFAYRLPLSPEELYFGRSGSYTIAVTAYLAEPKPFLVRPLEEQCMRALGAFKAQESVHAATYGHARAVRKVFGLWHAGDYLRSFDAFRASAAADAPDAPYLRDALSQAAAHLVQHQDDVERYCGFLTHEDFALHNIRIAEDGVYLIDSASLRFGNKYESWARFLNFMLLYNRPLEQALERYVRDNRAPEEVLALRLMRIYKLGELLHYHARAYALSSGNLKRLCGERLRFWTTVLDALLADTPVPDETVASYKRSRDALRSDEEKQRQRELRQL